MKLIQLGRSDLNAIVDDEDYELVKHLKWYLHSAGYVESGARKNKARMLLHRLILKASDDELVDHLDGNRLDNRRSNLRICTRADNARNSFKRKNTTSEFKGVYWRKQVSKWHAQICINYKTKALGLFSDEIQAAQAYDDAARVHFGQFARTNFAK